MLLFLSDKLKIRKEDIEQNQIVLVLPVLESQRDFSKLCYVQFNVGVDPILKGKVYDTLPQEWKNNCIGCNEETNLPGKNKNITKTENGETCI